MNKNKVQQLGMEELGWTFYEPSQPILQIPLHFNYPPVQILSKQLTKLNSDSPYRIIYLGSRWQNSNLFHKIFSQKHGYPYDLNKINKNNTFFTESMSNNQYYRNQIYYRAFEGMNPTLHQNQPIFESRFESGNLDCVVKVAQNQYDLFLRIDSNTRGHVIWYYFSVKNTSAITLKFNICNFTKKKILYNQKLKPYVLIEGTNQWTQDAAKNVTFTEKKLRYQFIYNRTKVPKLYELSFTYTFQGTQEVRFAYCIPYTYTQLRKDLKTLPKEAQVCILGRSLTGLQIPVVKIGSDDSSRPKKVVIITGRVHPGQTNGSIMMFGLLKYLCGSPQTEYLRKKIITIVVPMVNPDGVILGNSRAGACGKDLNRQFKSNNKSLYPEVWLIKQLVRQISLTHQIQTYLDFHGHSRKKNMFLFGPPYNITQSQYYKCRLIPKLISLATPIFRYFSCNYAIPDYKKTTARSVMLNQFSIPFFYTIQCSIGFYYDSQNRKYASFSETIWQTIGQNIISAIVEYFQGMEQYNIFIEAKRIKLKSFTKTPPIPFRELSRETSRETPIGKDNYNWQPYRDHKQYSKEIVNFSESPSKQFSRDLWKRSDKTEIKIIKLFQQIRNNDEREKTIKQSETYSDGSSDSYNQEEDLEKQQMMEFENTINQYVQNISTIITLQVTNTKTNLCNTNHNHFLVRNKHKQISKKEEMELLNEFINDKGVITKIQPLQIRTQIKSQRYSRKKKQTLKNITYEDKFQIYRDSIRKSTQNNEKSVVIQNQNQNQTQTQNPIVQFIPQSKIVLPQYNKVTNNVTIFNFSKMIQNNRSISLQDRKYYHRQNQYKIQSNLFPRSQNNKIAQLQKKLNRYQQQQEISQQDVSKSINIDNSKFFKSKVSYPAPFYRIKCQSVIKNKKQKRFIDERIKIKIHSPQKPLFLNIQKISNK